VFDKSLLFGLAIEILETMVNDDIVAVIAATTIVDGIGVVTKSGVIITADGTNFSVFGFGLRCQIDGHVVPP
jgi:hypothetical protein